MKPLTVHDLVKKATSLLDMRISKNSAEIDWPIKQVAKEFAACG